MLLAGAGQEDKEITTELDVTATGTGRVWAARRRLPVSASHFELAGLKFWISSYFFEASEGKSSRCPSAGAANLVFL